jgi:hypothetical protein
MTWRYLEARNMCWRHTAEAEHDCTHWGMASVSSAVLLLEETRYYDGEVVDAPSKACRSWEVRPAPPSLCALQGQQPVHVWLLHGTPATAILVVRIRQT